MHGDSMHMAFFYGAQIHKTYFKPVVHNLGQYGASFLSKIRPHKETGYEKSEQG